jgi:hypothetical protein
VKEKRGDDWRGIYCLKEKNVKKWNGTQIYSGRCLGVMFESKRSIVVIGPRKMGDNWRRIYCLKKKNVKKWNENKI